MPEHFIKKLALAANHLNTRMFVKTFLETCYSFNHYYLIRLNLKNLKEPTPSRLAYRVEKLQDEHIEKIRGGVDLLDPGSKRHLISRIFLYERGLVNCYGLITEKDDIACIQWLIYPSENDLLQRSFPRRYLPLNDREVMLENVFVLPRFRGLGLLQSISNELLQKAKAEGFRTAVGYVRNDAFLSLNEFIRMGFTIRKLVTEYKLFGYTKRVL